MGARNTVVERGRNAREDREHRGRRLIDVETHVTVFTWVLERLSATGLVRGKTVGVDATTLEANAAMRSIERRDKGESYEAFVQRLAEASGIATPTRAESLAAAFQAEQGAAGRRVVDLRATRAPADRSAPTKRSPSARNRQSLP